MAFKKPYDKPVRKSFKVEGPSMTKQAFKKECDINNIMRKYQKSGLLEHVTNYQGDYSDLTDVPDYQDALNKVIDANTAFSTLPSSVRKRFNNDPASFLQFVDNPNNESEMREIGLLPPQPDFVPVEDPPPSEPVE